MAWMMLILVLGMLCSVHAAVADDAMVLPQGVFRVSVDTRFSFPITERFTPSGGTKDRATDFNRDLNSTVFPDLQLVEAAYGLTDRLSLGVRVPLLGSGEPGAGGPR